MADVATAIRKYLLSKTAITSIISTRLYPGVLPTNPTLPAVTMQIVEQQHESHLAGASGIAHAVIRFEAYDYDPLDLRSDTGRRFGYQFTLFRVGLRPGEVAQDSAWRTEQVYMGHLAISDIADASHYSAERFARAAAGLAGAAAALSYPCGEKIVSRILDKQMLKLDLTELGFEESSLEMFKEALARPWGIILVTGPTGSGKTTTLCAALNKIYSPQKKIITIEDPVEYKLPGIVQTQVEEINIQLKEEFNRRPDANLIATIPGIGFYGALLILAEIDDVHRFRHSENLCAYAGLVPTVSQSASSVKYGSISKDGSAYLRWILTESVHVHTRLVPGSQLSRFHARLAKRRGRRIATVATSRKLLRIIYWMLVRHEPFHSHGFNPVKRVH